MYGGVVVLPRVQPGQSHEGSEASGACTAHGPAATLMAETVAGVLAILLIVSILLYVYFTVR